MFTADGGGAYELRVHNIGKGPTTQLVTVTDPLPTGLELESAVGSGWNCASSSTQMVCTRSDGLASGASYPAIVLAVSIHSGVAVPIHNVAMVSTPDDADPSNDSGSDTVRSLSRPAPAPALSCGGIAIALLVLLLVAATRLRRTASRPPS